MKTIDQLTTLFIVASESKAQVCGISKLINPFNDCEFEAVKYAIEVIQNEIKAQAIEEALAEILYYDGFVNANELYVYAQKLRGENT